MNTKADYLHDKDNTIPGWQDHWRALLEGRFIIVDDDLVEDTNARIFRLGFTVEEVSGAIGFSGTTDRETDWRAQHPERYADDGSEVYGWREALAKQRRLEALNDALADVDARVAVEKGKTFVYDGHNYYMDRDYIVGVAAALPILPSSYTQRWKTADKEEDGINNIYVVLDKSGLAGLAGACLSAFAERWAAGDAEKVSLKEAYAAEVEK